MELKISGPAYEVASQVANFQKCINMFPSSTGPDGRGTSCLLPTAGKKTLVASSGKEVRALILFNDTIYTIIDNSFYKVTFNEDALTMTLSSVLGTLATSTGPVSVARNPTQIMIVDGSTTGYVHTVSTDIFTTLDDADFTGGKMVVFMDSYFIYNTPNAATMFTTASNNGLAISALDVITAEGKPDKLVGLAVDKRELWAFGETGVDIYYDAANATGFPFTRREGAFIDQGCAAAYSILNHDNTIYWLDNRGFVVRAEGYGLKVISTEAVNLAINSYRVITDAIATSSVEYGHLFYILTFPTENKTWAYDSLTGMWHERASFTAGDVFIRDRINCHIRYKQYEIGGDFANGKIYLISNNYYDDAGEPIHRIRVTSHQQAEFNQIGVNTLELALEVGKGTVTGTGSDPQIMMRYSNDSGYTWSHELTRSLGKLGEYSTRVHWNRLGTARKWLFEFRITDPIKFAILDASADVDGGP